MTDPCGHVVIVLPRFCICKQQPDGVHVAYGQLHFNFESLSRGGRSCTKGQGTPSLGDGVGGPLQGESIYCLIDGPGQPGILPAALEGAWLCQRVDMPGEAWLAASSAIHGLFPLAPSASRGTKVRGAPGPTHLQPQRLLPAEEHLPALASEGRVALQVAEPRLGMAEWARAEAAAEHNAVAEV